MALAARFHNDFEKGLAMQAAVMRETQLSSIINCPGYIQVCGVDICIGRFL